MADLGFAVNTHTHTVSNATLKKFAKFAVANISDAVSRTNGTVDLRPIHRQDSAWRQPDGTQGD